ncbi:NAD(P)-binding domain-containing protein [Madurella fahalii]|uniref:NAD(P)-binding domain-containing protein n=1 Tax=Madurella fahalii TaxID=1157608 RepID=A0ABQ0G464_9PEZI
MSARALKKVAIIGATGRIGGAFTEALLQTNKHTVTALMRAGSNGTIPKGVKVVKVDYEDEVSIIEALKDQEFVAITLGVKAPEDLHRRIVAAAGKAGVPYIMPNVYSYPIDRYHIAKEEDVYGKLVLERINGIEKHGLSSPITLACGFWYEWSLALGNQGFGFTIKDRKVTFFDDGKRTITVSTWDQCGRALAAFLSLPESGASPSIADFKNKFLLINSFRVSQRDMLDSLHRVMGTTDADWDITYESTAKRVQEGTEELKKGMFTGFVKTLYGGVFMPSNPNSDYAATQPMANDILGLPKEGLDEATKRAVDMVQNGWNPFAE